MTTTSTPTEAREIPLDQIEITIPRSREVEKFNWLKKDLRANGQKIPIQVQDLGRKNAEGIRYKLICGQGRTEAARQIGWTHITALIVEANDEQRIGRFFNENVNRQSLPWAAKGRIIRDEINAGKSMADICAELNISEKLGQRYLAVIQNVAQEIADEVESMGMNVAEKLTKLPAKGQTIVVEVAKATEQPVEHVVKAAQRLQAKGDGWTQAALRKAILGVKDTLDRQRKQLKLLRRDYALGPQNVLRLLRNPKINAALRAAKVNLETLDILDQ